MSRKQYQVAFELYGKMSSTFKNTFASGGTHIHTLNRKVRDLNMEMRKLDQSYKKGEMSSKQYESQQRRLQAQLARTEKAHRSLSKARALESKVKGWKDSSRGAIFDNIARAGMLASPINEAMKYESAMAGVKKVVDFDTPEQFQQMSKDILELSKRIPMAKEELAELVAAGGQGGVDKSELLNFGEDAAKMGVAFDISGGDAGQLMAEWRAAFKMNQKEVVELADKINYLGNKGAASATQISEVVQRIGPLGEVGGLASGEIAALGSSLIEVGIAPEVASTGIKKLITTMTSGKSATKTQQKAFEKLGFSSAEMAKKMQEDATGAITDLLSAIKKVKPEEQVSMLKQLFGEDVGPTLAPLLNNLDRVQELLTMVGDEAQYAGSMQAEFDAMSGTTANQLQLLKNNLSAVATAGGELLLPAINDLIEKVTPWINKAQEWIEQNPKLAKGIAVGTAGVLGFSIAAAGLSYAAALIISPFTKIISLMAKLRHLPTILGASSKAAKGLGGSLACGGMGMETAVGDTKKKKNKKTKKGKAKNVSGGGKPVASSPVVEAPKKTPKKGGFFSKLPKPKMPKLGGIGAKGALKGVAKIGLRAVPGVGTAMLAMDAFSLAKRGFDKAGGLDGVKKTFSSFGRGKEGTAISQTVTHDTTRASNMAGVGGRNVTSNFNAGLTGIGGTMIGTGLYNQFGAVANTSGTYGQATGANFSGGLEGGMNIGGFATPLYHEMGDTALVANAYGGATGDQYGTGLMGHPIPAGQYVTPLMHALNAAAIASYYHGQNIAQQIAQGLASGKAAIAQQVQEIASLARQAATINVSVKGGASSVPRYAKGGIINRAHIGMIGEAGPEAIIPLNNKPRSHGLLQRTASMMGYNLGPSRAERIDLSAASPSNSSIQVDYAPQIIIQGNASKREIENVLSDDKRNLEKTLENIKRRKERVSFA